MTPKKKKDKVVIITLEVSKELAQAIDSTVERSGGLWSDRSEFLKDSLRLHLIGLRPEGGL
jgi:Arc/MetJ-type ribon-helix-helix transcriptional regulator